MPEQRVDPRRVGGVRPMSLPAFRSILFVPGDRPDRYESALSAGADAVCIDLEDAVADARKVEGARGGPWVSGAVG